jgi:hypothetical protein
MTAIDVIQLTVAERFGLSVAELTGKSTKRVVALPRQIAVYLAKQTTEASLPEIGRAFGGRHHTTVMHAIAKMDELRRTDAALDRTVRKLMDTLQAVIGSPIQEYTQMMAQFPTLTEAATAWLTSGLSAIEQEHAKLRLPIDGVSVKFTWNGQDYEVGVRKLEDSE